ncbi:hypothetical protein ABK905_21375 [Acerihabitans sp. KWT182]|uniref:Kinase OspG kinase domain-containing protein n=1 Tax=Acerihabitans sp. KWT182 TaxID=3157919 RepID=A0AAU7Q7K1_9GAMM
MSQDWHLSEHNGHPVFNTRQERVINKLNKLVSKEYKYLAEQNENPKRYGNGIIYRVEDAEGLSDETVYHAVEMNGMLVPVRTKTTLNNRLHYEIYDIDNNQLEAYPVEFDGSRWLFERPTSIHASNSLREAVTSDMFVEVDATLLSTPGQRGLRWDAEGKSYLKIENQYVQLKKLNGNRYRIQGAINKRPITLRYNNEKFSVETARERLNNIYTEGLSGRKRKNAMDVLKEQDGFSEASARQLLQEYQFPETGFYDEYNFALEIEQMGEIPQWAKRFKKSTLAENAASDAQSTVKVVAIDQPGHPIELKLGKMLGEGGYGSVFIDADNNQFVIKKYVRNHEYLDVDIQTLIVNECSSFRRYYGADSARIYHDGNEFFYMRMYRVPGKTIPQLAAGALPPDAIERYVDMLEKLNHVGIIHSDLHEGNIIWDEEAKIFHPIDIYNIKDQYFRRTAGDTFQDGIDEQEWAFLIEDITSKMRPSDQA